jgi:hypothetical protein
LRRWPLTEPACNPLVCQPRAWQHISARKVADANCVLAFAAGAYDFYLGDSTVALLSNASFFNRAGAFLKHGWSGAPCLTPAAAMCEMPAANYPCPSPPSPPTAPDQPAPLPPTTPAEASCGWQRPADHRAELYIMPLQLRLWLCLLALPCTWHDHPPHSRPACPQ